MNAQQKLSLVILAQLITDSLAALYSNGDIIVIKFTLLHESVVVFVKVNCKLCELN